MNFLYIKCIQFQLILVDTEQLKKYMVLFF
jgi:hypothetical protein